MLTRLKPAKVIEVIIHILLWVFITVVPLMGRPYSNMPAPFFFRPWNLVLINSLLAVQFYLNAFYLVPVILKKNQKIVLYFILLFISFIIINALMGQVLPRLPLQQFGKKDIFAPRPPFGGNFNLFSIIVVTAASFAYRYLADQFQLINNKKDIDNAALVSELAFLRSQISPHFIFNVINSVVSLSRFNPSLVEPTLIKLSKLMRYMLYISDEEKVTLGQKVDYLQSYIELQKLRFQDLVDISLIFDISSPEKTIEPMLLIPFVENAFKHGACNIHVTCIKIHLNADNKTLNFSVINNFEMSSQNTAQNNGIGLNNVKRRLELLYPGKHSLLINHTGNNFMVNLQIQLK